VACTYCGARLAKSARFCPTCGRLVPRGPTGRERVGTRLAEKREGAAVLAVAQRQVSAPSVSWRQVLRFVAFALVVFNLWERMAGVPRGPMNTLFTLVALMVALGTSRFVLRLFER
jgi:hypothetical protein